MLNKVTDLSVSTILNRDTKRAILGGVVAALFAGLGIWSVGASSGRDARVLLEAALPSLRFLCSSVMTSTASILALMLTLLSFSQATTVDLQSTHYSRVRQIGLIDSAVFVLAILLLLLLSIPVGESDTVPTAWFTTIYYIAIGYAAILGGALITTILMLYNAVRDLIRVVHPDEESEIAQSDVAASE